MHVANVHTWQSGILDSMSIIQRLIPPFSIIAQAWSGKYKASENLGKPDCALGFSFGYRGKQRATRPGLSNQDLANVLLKHHADLPKILQFEIADAYVEAEGKNADSIERITKHRVEGKYLDTREVAVQAKAIMEQHGWKTALLVAHPYHMPRVQAVCNQLDIQWVATPEERGAVEFDPQSSQGWTRDLDAWRGYEPMAIMFYRLKGWL